MGRRGSTPLTAVPTRHGHCWLCTGVTPQARLCGPPVPWGRRRARRWAGRRSEPLCVSHPASRFGVRGASIPFPAAGTDVSHRRPPAARLGLCCAPSRCRARLCPPVPFLPASRGRMEHMELPGGGGGDLGSRGRSSEPERQFPARVTGHRVRRGAARGSGPSCGPECGARRARAGWCAGAPAGPIHGHTAAVGARCGLGKGGTRGSPVRAALGLPRSDVQTPPTSVPCRAEGRCSPPPPPAFMAPAAGKFQGWICLTPISSRGIAFCLCQQHRQHPPAPAPPPRGSPPQQHRHTRVPLHLLPPIPARRFTFCHRRGHPRPAGRDPPPPPHVRGTARCDSPQRPPETLGAVPQPDPAQPRAAAELPPTPPERPPSDPPRRPALRGPPHALSLPSSPRTPQHEPPRPTPPPSPGTRREDVAGWGRELRDPPGDAAAPVPMAGCGAGAGAGAGLTCVCGRPRAFTSGRDRGAICTAGLRSGRALKPKTRSGPNHCQTRRPRAFMGGLEQGR